MPQIPRAGVHGSANQVPTHPAIVQAKCSPSHHEAPANVGTNDGDDDAPTRPRGVEGEENAVESTLSGEVLADRDFANVELLLDSSGGHALSGVVNAERETHAAATLSSSRYQGHREQRQKESEEAHKLLIDDAGDVISTTTRAGMDQKASALASGDDLRFAASLNASLAPIPADASDSSGEARGEDENTRNTTTAAPTATPIHAHQQTVLTNRPCPQRVATGRSATLQHEGSSGHSDVSSAGDMATARWRECGEEAEGESRDSGDGSQHTTEDERAEQQGELTHEWRNCFAPGATTRVNVGSGGVAAADDLFYALGEATDRVLVYFFPSNNNGSAQPSALTSSADDDVAERGEVEIAGKKEKTDLRHFTRSSADGGSGSSEEEPPSTPPKRSAYCFLFLNAEDARAATTLPADGLTSASDNADKDTPLWRLLLLLARLVLPVALTQLLRTSMGTITTAFMGNYLSTNQFAAAATGLSFANLTALNIGNGFSAALDTLATQEHGRRKHSPEIVAILFRGVICTFAVYLPIAIFYYFCEPLLSIVIHADLVADTAYFLRMSVFIVTPMIVSNNLIRFAQAQRVTQLGVVSATVGLLSLVPLLFLFGRDSGIPGVVLALSLNRLLVMIIAAVAIWSNAGLVKCWRGRTVREHFSAVFLNPRDFLRFVKTGLPILAANCADSWGFEALAIIAAHLGALTAAAWSVLMSIYSQLFALHLGIAVAAAIRVGNAIGAGKGLLARRYVHATIVLSIVCGGFCAFALWALGSGVYDWLQANPAVTAQGGEHRLLAACTFFFDAIFYALQGPFRGVGRNGVLLFLVAVSMWGIAVPLSILLGVVRHWAVAGLLTGLLLGMMTGAPAQAVFLLYGVPWSRYEQTTTITTTTTATTTTTTKPDASSEA